MKRSMLVVGILGATLAALVLPGAPAYAAGIGQKAVVTGLPYPAAFTFAPDGRIFFGERLKGSIHIWNPATKNVSDFYTITHVLTDGERGLLGVALHPNYPASPYVYAYATRDIGGTIKNQILRIKNVNAHGAQATVIYSSNAAADSYHDGGRILFGPDGMLYAIVGDAHDSGNAQDTSISAGKILRMEPNGTVPAGNQYPGREFAIGIRNSFGFTFDFANTGLLWETENGPECNDEVNLIESGKDYGWGPAETCSTPPPAPNNTNQNGANPVLPIRWWGTTIAPTGAVFCDGCGLTGFEGDLFFGAYNTGDIRDNVLTSDRMDIASQTVALTHSEGILSMERGLDGTIYFSDTQGIFKLINA
jgi:aldose sugar dehydrogenase